MWKRAVKGMIKVLCVCVLCALFAVLAADYGYWKQNRESCLERAGYFRTCMEEEKIWISSCQGEEGEIYMYAIKSEEDSGTVVPYFAAQAAMGLLAGQPQEEMLEKVADYLAWHAGKIVENDGIVYDYQRTEEGLTAKEKYDSIDSYLAAFLTLLATYQEKGGELSSIPMWQQAVEIGVDTLKELSPEGLSMVSYKKATCYLMDNVEVQEAWQKLGGLFASGDPALSGWRRLEELQREAAEQQERNLQQIRTVLWNTKEQRYEVGLGGNGIVIHFQGYEEWYPDAIAQVYPLAMGIEPERAESGEALYRKITQQHAWKYLMLEDSTFDWSVLSYIAAKQGDIESAEYYLEKYRMKYSVSRKYPLSTADAAWAARAYEELAEYYEGCAGKSLLDNWKEDVKEAWLGAKK